MININTNNLREGMIIKNYKELCKLLDINITTGKSKIIQLREINRYIDLLKTENNNSYIVLEIYDKPIPSNVKGKYTKFIQDILLYYLSKQDKIIYINKSELIKVLGLVNDKYLEYRHNKDKLLDIADKYNINEFYKRCDAKILSIIESSLKSLKNRLLIDYSDAYKIYYLDSHNKYVYKIANLEEHKYILEVKKRVLDEFNLHSEYQIYYLNLRDEYYRRINNIVEDEMCWEGVFQCYQIIYNQHQVLKEIQNQRLLLNAEVKKAIDIQAEKKELDLEIQKLLSDKLITLKENGDV